MSHEFERHYKTSEVAKILGVDRRTIWRWIKEGKIKGIKLPGKLYVIPESEVKRILEGRSR
jgi:excisionase family DNA binding protein